MTNYRRFAIFAAPAPGPLADFAAAWLGWDAMAGRKVAHPALPNLPHRVAEITAAPRKYGFHATLKPPFQLASSSNRTALERDVTTLATRLAPVHLDGLSLMRLGGFLALVPEGDTTALSLLASEVVRALDAHRAPPSPQELSRRRSAGLNPQQNANLQRWGYPYVMESFRFHFTLTGRLPRSDAETVIVALTPQVMPLLSRPFPIDALHIFGEDDEGRFYALSRHPLGG